MLWIITRQWVRYYVLFAILEFRIDLVMSIKLILFIVIKTIKINAMNEQLLQTIHIYVKLY